MFEPFVTFSSSLDTSVKFSFLSSFKTSPMFFSSLHPLCLCCLVPLLHLFLQQLRLLDPPTSPHFCVIPLSRRYSLLFTVLHLNMELLSCKSLVLTFPGLFSLFPFHPPQPSRKIMSQKIKKSKK